MQALAEYKLDRLERLAAHWAEMSKNYPDGDVMASMQALAASDLKAILEITEVPAGWKGKSLLESCNQNAMSVKGLLCSAFEGGSNYWYMIEDEKTVFAKGLGWADFVDGGQMQDPDNYWHWSQLIPLTPGCALIISDKEGDDPEFMNRRLDLQTIEQGLRLMRDVFPRHWMNFEHGNDDAETGDLFLQLCLFGKVVFS